MFKLKIDTDNDAFGDRLDLRKEEIASILRRAAVTSATRLMQQAEEKIIDRLKLLYDPMYAIVGIASLVPQLTSPSIGDDPLALALGLRALRFYPQIQSLYVGFENGDFFMMTHFTGDKSAVLRAALGAPSDAAFAIEMVRGNGGGRTAQWSFLSDAGAVMERRDPIPATFDPRNRPWYLASKNSDVVAESGLYFFASSHEPGFTLSRSFAGPTPGVMGADLAAIDLSEFLGRQKITPSSTADERHKERQRKDQERDRVEQGLVADALERLFVAWIDRRLGRSTGWRSRDDD